jgi:hypothetical protein
VPDPLEFPPLQTLLNRTPQTMTKLYSLLALACLALMPAALLAQNDIDAEARKKAEEAMLAKALADSLQGWHTGGLFQLNMTQVSLSNWAAGGFSSISGLAQFNGTANWKRGKKAWDNTLILAFGGQQQQDGPSQKTDDRIELNSKYGYELSKAWYVAGLAQLRTQFTEGFNTDGVRISNFMAPGFILGGIGIDHRPSENFTAYFSPAMARLVVVNDKGLWGGSTDPDLRVYGVLNGNTTEFELGGYFRFQYQTKLAENITFLTRGDFFSNYLRNPENIDITWETLFGFKVNSWFGASFGTIVVYDHDTQLPRINAEGIPYTGPATQFKQTLGIGLTVKL